MPMVWTSVCVSSSHNSMCDDATRISCGPFRVPDTYDVVRSSGRGRMTTRAWAKSVVVGVVPPNSPMATCSYSNGRLIHFLEALAGNGVAVDRHRARGQREDRLAPRGEQRRCRDGQGAGEQRQRDRRIGLDRHFGRIGGELAPALCFLETGTGRAAEMRHIGHDLQRVAVPADFVAVELRLHARLVDEILRRAAAEDDGRGPRAPDDQIRGLDDVADDVDIAGARLLLPRL